MPNCELCGELMPAGEEMFNYHGYSGLCPKPPKSEPVIEYSVDRLKKMAKCVHIAVDKDVAGDLAGGLLWAVKRIEELERSDRCSWLIEMPGAYLSARRLGGYEFFWTTEPNLALRFHDKDQADLAMMAIRQLRPELFFGYVDGKASWFKPVEHRWLGM